MCFDLSKYGIIVFDFKKDLELYLSKKYHMNITLEYLFNYLTITSDSWRQIIESYLGSKRFGLLIPQKYVKDSLNFLRDYKKNQNNKYLGINLITPLKKKINERKGSLFKYIKASNLLAEDYAKAILNGTFEMSYDEFKQKAEDGTLEDGAVVLENIIFKNNSITDIKLTNLFFIGQDAIKIQISQIENEMKELTLDYKQSCDEFESNTLILKNIELIQNLLDDFNKNYNWWKSLNFDIKRLKENLQEAQEGLDLCKTNDFISKMEKIDSLQECQSKLDEKIKIFVQDNISPHKESKKNNEEEINRLKDQISVEKFDEVKFSKDYKNEYMKYIDSTLDDLKGYEWDLKNEHSYLKKNFDGYQNDYYFALKDLNDLLQVAGISFGKEDEDAIRKYYFEIGDEIENIKNNIAAIKRNLIQLVCDYINTQIKYQIDKTKKKISNLNRDLAQVEYGIDEKMNIRFSDKTFSDDDKIQSLIYYFINRNAPLNLAFNESDEDFSKLEELSKLLLGEASPDLNSNEKLNTLLDYREYINLDIEIIQKGASYLMSDTRGKVASNGEKKRRLIVLMTLAFVQCLDNRITDSSILIIIDEFTNDLSDSVANNVRNWCCNYPHVQFVISQQSSPYALVPRNQYVFKKEWIEEEEYTFVIGRDLNED